MNFEQSKLLDTLPKQFFANLVAKVNKKIRVDYRMKLATQLVVNKKRHSA